MPSHRAEAPQPSRRRGQRKERSGGRIAHRAPQTLTLSVPQAGIAGALGLATIAAPLTGMFAAPAAKPVMNTSVPAALAPAPAFPALQASASNAVADGRLIPDDTLMSSVPALIGAPRTVLVARAARGSQRAVLPGCDGVLGAAEMPNGDLPSSDLCSLWDGKHKLRTDAAVAFAKLNLAYRKHFGHDMCITDAYRTLAQQYAVKASRGSFAATPGTSKHGLGLAVDLCDGVPSGGTTYWWLRNNAPAYGWDNPDWARAGGSGPHENWHWEYIAGEGVPTTAPDN